MHTAISTAGENAGTPNGRRRQMSRGRAVVADRVARSFRVPESALFSRSRATAREALARHVAMYLAHVVLGWSQARVAESFARHRTTVLYACARVEDRRDDPQFDARVTRLERGIEAALGTSR